MSWPTWHTTAPPMPGVQPPIQSSVIPNAINPAPALLPPPNAATIPSGMHYSPEQWAQMQQQNWQQWAQWQQQYQQWHQQYGAEYQKSMNALSASTTNTAVPPPPPNENKPPPPPPPDDGVKTAQYNTPQHRPSTGYSTFPPPTQQYLNGPPPNQYPDQSQTEWQTSTNKRPIPQNEEYESNKRQMIDKQNQPPRSGNSWQNQPPPNCQSQAQKVLNLEELTEAEKKFDKEFAAWEAQFNKWKEQNANHPDKTQYLEYEKKWESWRNSLLDRREQMRKKRVALQASMSATPPPKAATMLPHQSFKQPPPLQQVYSNKKDQIDDFSKPPPTQNNDPLLFKPSAGYSDESIQNESSDVGSSFLKSSSPTPGGIPGLDLVKEGPSQDNIGDNPSEPIEVSSQTVSKGPDLDAISKGINTILGDTKLLNMLSMVSQKQNLSAGMPIDTQLKPPEAHQPKPSAPPIPSLLNMPIQHRPNFEKSEHSYDDYEAYGSGQRETVNNFDDQTRMSFSNGPNEQELNYINNSVNSARSDKSNNFRRFADADNRHMFGNNPNNEYTFSRNNSYENPPDTHSDNFRNMNGPAYNRDSIVASRDTLPKGNFGQTYSQRHNDRYENHNQYAEDVADEQWNEEDEYDKYHDMFNEGEHSLEMPSKNIDPLPSQDDQPVQDEPLFVPEVVVDYEHKPLKDPEPEISIDMIRMFDYRHKPVNRIPYPQRPIWLSASLRNIKQFDPLGTGRFSNNDRTHFERDTTRYGGERIEPFNRRPGFEDRDYQSNDDKFRFSRDRYPENRNDWRSNTDMEFNREREITRPNDPNHRQVNLEMCRNRYSEEINDTVHIDKKLELEDLSDEEWIDDKNYSTKDTLKFSPPRKRDDRSPEISLRGNTTNTGNNSTTLNQNTTLENLINPPGRYNRPQRIVIILRGPPGSGKTYLARVIKDREVENGGSAPRILSLDDYFMVEHEKEVMEDGKAVRIKEMTYEYEAEMEESYRQSLIKAFKKTITDGYFHFVIVDNVNQKVKNFGEMWSFAKQNGFQVYICQMDLDPELCTRRNIHHRSESYIEDCISGWEPTPSHHPLVDPTSFLQSLGSITEVEMEEADQPQDQKDDTGEPGSMVSANLSGPPGQWKNSSNWTTNGKSLGNPQKPVKRGFDGPTWKNRNNRGR